MGEYAATIAGMGAGSPAPENDPERDLAQPFPATSESPVVDNGYGIAQPIPAAPKPMATPAPAGPYADTIRLMATRDALTAKGTLLDAADAKPDHAAAAASLAPTVGAPASAVEADLAAYQAQAELQKNAGILDRNPVLSQWLAANPAAARIAKDDFDNLDFTTKAWRALSSGVAAALLQNQRGRLGSEAMTGADVGGQVGAIDKSIAANPQLSGVYGKLQGVAGFAGGMLDNFFKATPLAAEGAIAGAGAGAVGLVPGAAAGAAAGGLGGFAVGWKWDMARVAAGNAYLNMGEIKDAAGNGIDETARQAASVLVGLGTYAIAGIGAGQISNAATAARTSLFADAVKEAVTQPSVARSLTRFGGALAKSGVEGAALNAAMEGTNIAGEEIAKQLSQGDFKDAFNDAATRQSIVDRLMTAAIDGAEMFPLLHLPFAAGSLVGDTLRARQGAADAANFGDVISGATTSKVRARAPGVFNSFLRQQSEGSPVENLFIPGDKVRELYQSMGVEPGADDGLLGHVAPDIADQLRQAQETGGDVVLPAADYVTHLAGTPVHETLAPDLRVRADGFSLREAADYEKQRGEMLEANAVAMKDQTDHAADVAAPARAVYDDMFSKLRAAGYTVDAARQNSSLVAARYQARSERLEGKAGTAADLYSAEGLDVKRVLPRTLEHVPVDDTDMVINGLRKGSRLPSDRELFGPSLSEFVAKRGGVVDTGGELKAMDAHKTKGLVRPATRGTDAARDLPGVDRVGAINPDADYYPDRVAQIAHEAGYFDEAQEVPSGDDLIEAIRDDLGGNKRYAGGGALDERRAGFKQAVGDLDQFLNEQNIDIKTATNAEIKDALRKFQAEGVEENDDRSFLQKVGNKARELFQGKKSQGELFKDRIVQPQRAGDGGVLKFTDDGHALMYDYGKRLVEGGKPEPKTRQSLWDIFSKFELGDRDAGTPFDGVKDVDDWARGWYEDVKDMPMPDSGVLQVGSFVDPGEQLRYLMSRVYEQENRGKITLADGKALISLFKDSDLSTFLHESGHLWLDEMVRDASRADAPQGLKDDMAIIRKWMGLKDGDEIGVEHHEQFARGFEAYLLEGKAPSTALGAAFAKFKAWLTRLYQSVQTLKVPMNDHIRGVMDRMLASDEEINQARRQDSLNPLFANAQEAGMTNAEFAAYTKGIGEARQAADRRLLDKTMAAVRARETAAYQREAAWVREDVARQVKARPDLKAEHFIRTGKMLDDPEAEPAVTRMKLSREALRDMYGNDEAASLLPRGVTADKGGVHPDEVADLFGYRSGDELTRALMSMEATRRQAETSTGQKLGGQKFVNHLIDSETDQIMMDRHGDALNDGSIEEEAVRAVHNAAQADVMAMELRALARKAGVEAPLKIEDIRAWVDGEIADMPLKRGTDTAGFARAEGKAGREVERALLKGDYPAAFRARQKQLVNHLFAARAGEMAGEVESAQALFKRMAAKGSFPAVEQSYVDRVHEILKRIGIQGARGDAELRRGLNGETLQDFVAAKEGEGRELLVPSFLLDPTWSKSPATMSVDEFLGVYDAIRSLIHNGRDEKTVMVDGKRQELGGLVDEAVDRIETMPKRKLSNDINAGTASGFRGMLERVGVILRTTDAALLKQEQVFDWLDGRDPNGVFNRVVFRRLKDAQHKENDLLAAVTGRIKALGDAMPKGWSKGLNERKSYPELRNKATGEAYTFRRQDILAMALNTGNDGNFDKLAKGYGWTRDQVHAVLDRELHVEDWDFIQGVWDTFESLYPDIEAMTRRVTGVGPEKVEATPFYTEGKNYRGGYYPVVYDPLKSRLIENQRQRSGAALFENNYTRATTPKGHTISRVEDFARPLRLSLDVMPWKLRQSVHDLAFREAVIDADKFLNNDRVLNAVDGSLGKEYASEFRKWLQSIANDTNIDDKGLAGLDWLARQARVNTTMVGVGFRVSTMVKHGTTALSNSFGEIGAKAMLDGAMATYGSPDKMRRSFDFALSRSGELRNRMNSIDRDVREGLRTLQGETGIVASAERYGHYGVAMMDMGSAVPTWYGAYRKAIAAGETEPDAVYMGDKSVRNAHGAQGVTDIARIQRGGEVAKLMTMFYGFFNHIYNRQRDTIHTAAGIGGKVSAGDYVGARRDFAMVMARSIYYLIVPALVEQYMSQGAPDESKDESWGGWAAKAIIGEMPAGVPLLRDAAKYAMAQLSGKNNVGYEMSPVEKAVETSVGSIVDLTRALGLSDKEVSGRWLQHAIETPGYVFGLPSGQAGGTAQYLWDVLGNESEQPDGVADFFRGLMYGPKPKGQR